jgi:hypothetical protein
MLLARLEAMSVGNLKKTGADTLGAAKSGDIKGTFSGLGKGAGETVGGVGSGAGKTVNDAGEGANKLVGGAGKNLGKHALQLLVRLSRLTKRQATRSEVLLERLSETQPTTLERPCRAPHLESAKPSETRLVRLAKAT